MSSNGFGCACWSPPRPPTPCGELQNNSGRTIRVSLNWNCTTSSEPLGSGCPLNIKSVAPHSHIGGGSVDVDAFEVPSNCLFNGKIDPGGHVFSRGAGWYKFDSLQTVTITGAGCF